MTTPARTALREHPAHGFDLPDAILDVFTEIEGDSTLAQHRSSVSAARKRAVEPRLDRIRQLVHRTL